METILESTAETHLHPRPSAGDNAPPPSSDGIAGRPALQHQERVVDDGGDRKRSPARRLTPSTSVESMESMLTLSDVDFGMEEQAKGGVAEEEEPKLLDEGVEEKKVKVNCVLVS